MGTKTKNYGLNKPYQSDAYDIAVQNENMDIIDAHTHPYSSITGTPVSLPADGGNADTLEGKHATDFALKTDLSAYTPLTAKVDADTLDGLHASSFIQTSQSAKVIVSTTAPTDTTAVWVVPS